MATLMPFLGLANLYCTMYYCTVWDPGRTALKHANQPYCPSLAANGTEASSEGAAAASAIARLARASARASGPASASHLALPGDYEQARCFALVTRRQDAFFPTFPKCPPTKERPCASSPLLSFPPSYCVNQSLCSVYPLALPAMLLFIFLFLMLMLMLMLILDLESQPRIPFPSLARG